MSLKKNLVFMGFSTGTRVGFGMLSFVVLARNLGPELFGQLMLWVSSGMLMGLIANFGMTPYLLREISVNRNLMQQTMSEAFSIKVLLSLTVVLCAATAGFSLFDLPWGFLLIVVAFQMDAFTELFNVSLRASSQYRQESKLATVASVAQFAILAGTVTFTQDLNNVAVGFLFSRIAFFSIVGFGSRKCLPKLAWVSPRLLWPRLKSMFAYAADFALQSLFGQVDAVVLGAFCGHAVVGVYQTGMRLFQGAAQAAAILVNVFLPRIASVVEQRQRLIREANLMQMAFMGTGVLVGITFTLASKLSIARLFGEGFEHLNTLMPLFGLLFFVRFSAASFGVLLTALGQQRYRMWINAIQWAVLLASAPFLVGNYGDLGWLYSVIAGNLFLFLAYLLKALSVMRLGRVNCVIFGLGVVFFGAHFA